MGRLPKCEIKKCVDHVLIIAEINSDRVEDTWHALNDDISRNTCGEPFIKSTEIPGWIKSWAIYTGDDVAGM